MNVRVTERVSVFAAVVGCAVGLAASATTAQDATDVSMLREQITELNERLDTLEAVGSGFGGVSINGYAEVHINTSDQPGADDELDFHRLAIGLTYELAEWVRFSTEIDFEHAAQELELEYAQVDFLLGEAVNVRAGSLLMPMGALNERHEPTLFYSVERPYLYKYMIPTTWSAAGAGLFGALGPLEYRAYGVNSLDASGFSTKNGIRGGRQILDEAALNDITFVGRVEGDALPGVRLGLSGLYGNSGQGKEGLGDTPVTMLTADARVRKGVLEVRAAVVGTHIGDTAELTRLLEETIGKEQFGWHAELAMHLSGGPVPEGHRVVPFVRFEAFDTTHKVADGLPRSAAADREVVTAGIAYFPVPAVAVKGDAEWWSDASGADWTNLNLGLALAF